MGHHFLYLEIRNYPWKGQRQEPPLPLILLRCESFSASAPHHPIFFLFALTHHHLAGDSCSELILAVVCLVGPMLAGNLPPNLALACLEGRSADEYG